MSPWPALSTASEARDAGLQVLAATMGAGVSPQYLAEELQGDDPGVTIILGYRQAMHLPSAGRVSPCAHGVRPRDRCPVCEPVTRAGWSGFAPSDLPATQAHRSPALVRECVQRAIYRLRARTALDEAVGAFERHLAVLTPDAPGLEAVEAVLSKLDQARKILESDSFLKFGAEPSGPVR